MLDLPCRTDLPHYQFEAELDGTNYQLEFRWNDRAAAWFLEVRDSSGTPLLSGRRVCLNSFTLRRFRGLGLPPGELLCYDTSGTNTDPGLNDLGGRVRLLYFTAAEMDD